MHIDYLMKQINEMEQNKEKKFDLKNSFIFKIFQFCYITQEQLTFIRFEKDYKIDFSYIFDKNTQNISFRKETYFYNLNLTTSSELLNLSYHFDNYGYDIENIEILDNQFKNIFMETENKIIYLCNYVDGKCDFKNSRSFLIINNFLDLILSKIGNEWEYRGKNEISKIIKETYNEYHYSLEKHSLDENDNLIKSLRENNDETWFKQNMLQMFNDLKNDRNEDKWYEELIKKI